MAEWTLAQLKEHILALMGEKDKAVDAAFAAQKEAIAAALAAQKEAVNKAEADSEKWRQSANEWRGSMNDREVKFIGRDEFHVSIKALEDKLDGKNRMIVLSTVGAVVSLLIAVFSFALRL